MAKLLGPLSGTGWAGWTGEHKHRAFPRPLQSMLAATGLLDEKMLPLPSGTLVHMNSGMISRYSSHT